LGFINKSGRNDPGRTGIGAKRPGANGNRGETTQGANGIRGETTRYRRECNKIRNAKGKPEKTNYRIVEKSTYINGDTI
jgi:hypothetical protein